MIFIPGGPGPRGVIRSTPPYGQAIFLHVNRPRVTQTPPRSSSAQVRPGCGACLRRSGSSPESFAVRPESLE